MQVYPPRDCGIIKCGTRGASDKGKPRAIWGRKATGTVAGQPGCRRDTPGGTLSRPAGLPKKGPPKGGLAMRLVLVLAVALTVTSFFAFRALAGNKSNVSRQHTESW